MEALFTIVGTILGFILSEFAARLRERRNEGKQATAVRAIIRLEIAQNLQALIEMRTAIQLPIEGEQKRLTPELMIAQRLTNLSIPPFRGDAFHSQLSLLATALSEGEITSVFRLYERLRHLDALRVSLQTLGRDQDDAFDAANADGTSSGGSMFRRLAYMPREPFNDLAPHILREFSQKADQILKDGNPLNP